MVKYLRLELLLVMVPVTLIAHFLYHPGPVLTFVLACLAIVPLAGVLGTATEHVAARVGQGIGGLLNATFGNAAELIIAVMALRQGLPEVVKASLTGSILGNILLVTGLSFLAGGARFRIQSFNAIAAQSQVTMLSLAAIGLIMPAAFHHIASATANVERDLSFDIAVVLLLTYIIGLLFSLRTHKDLFLGEATPEIVEAELHDSWSLGKSIAVLVVATGFIAWMSEILVGSVEGAAHSLGMTSLFIGVVVVAIVGNAAEHSTAVLVALKNKMDLSVAIAVGSSIQIALFVAPVLVLSSYFIAPQPMDLVFSPIEVLAVFLAVFIAGQIASDGKSNWLEGAQLLSVYVILGLVFYFMPEVNHSP